MSRLYAEMMPEEIRRPERPEPINFAFRQPLDARELQMCRTEQDRQRLFDLAKRHAAASLAAHIAKHCKWMDRTPFYADGNMVLQIELTIEDRGAYENWMPRERQEGRREGYADAMQAATRSLPYGLAEAAGDFYE